MALTPALSTADIDSLSTNHICSIRQFAGTGIVPWSARTLDRTNTGNLYIAVVRMRDWVAASIGRSVAFAATADNAAPLWGQITTLVQDFLHSLYQQGALVGTTPSQAYFVRCDATTTTVSDIVNTTPEAEGEYSSYVPAVVTLLLNGADEHKLAHHLHTIEQVSMGISSGLDHCGHAARKLLEAYQADTPTPK